VNTTVTDYLDQQGVAYTIKTHSRPALTCETAAAERGVRVSQIVKCMIGETETGQVVVMLLPGDKTLKSSKARKFLGAKSLQLVPPPRLAEEFGLTVGAISPVQLLDRSTILMDPSVLDEKTVDISSGDPLAGVELAAADLRDVLDARLVEMVSTSSEA
jgi:Cys-tRNA(Pro) deacylase